MDQRRVVLAVVLSLVVVVAYNELVIGPRRTPPVPSGPDAMPPEPTTTGTAPAAPEPPAGAPTASANLSFEFGDAPPVVIDTDVWRATLTPQGGRLTSLQLKQFRKSVHGDSPLLELVEPANLLPLTLMLGPGESDAPVRYASAPSSLTLADGDAGEIVFTGETPSGLTLEKRVRFLGSAYVFDVDVRVRGSTVPPTIGMVLPQLEREGLGSSGSTTETAVILSQGKLTETPLTEKIEDLRPEQRSDARWIGFSVPFFAGAIASTGSTGGLARVERMGSRPIVRLEEPVVDGGVSFKVFMGPKSKEVLAEAGLELNRLIDFGWFWFIAIPMLNALRWLHRLTGNYGVDIILLTCVVRAATYPLTQKSFRSMKDMQKVQPQLKQLQEQYKDDQAKLQKEMMELYKRHGVNPFSGCLPMVLQIPIFVGLYNALSHAIELRHAPFALWITDLSAPEALTVPGIPFGIPVLTILMGATMLVQQWLTPQQGVDPTQRQMMMIMPVVFTFMFINFPSGLVLYWLVSNLLGIAQQYVMLGVPPK
jgi:YidC/Oxa1 family membrane protein insertase